MENSVEQLTELFPGIPPKVLRRCLEGTRGDLNLAIEKLLNYGTVDPPVQHQVQEKAPAKLLSPGRETRHLPPERLQTNSGRHNRQPRSNWRDLGGRSRNGSTSPALEFLPADRAKKSAELHDADFPDLASGYNSPLLTPPRSTTSKQASYQASPASSAHATPGAWTPSRGLTAPSSTHWQESLAADLHRRLSIEAERPASSAAGGYEAEPQAGRWHDSDAFWGAQSLAVREAWSPADLDGALAALSQSFPKADLELVKEVLSAAKGDEDLARMLLSGMMTPHASPNSSPGRQRAANPANHSVVGTPTRAWARTQPPGAAVHPQSSREIPRQPGSQLPSEEDFDRAAAVERKGPFRGPNAGGSGANRRPAAGRTNLHARSAAPQVEESSSGSEDEFQGDAAHSNVYQRNRAEALRLDKKRFRRLRQAARSYAAGDHFHAKLLVQEAKSIKVAADAAHRQAAARIEREHNRGKDVWELDLHGLHLEEANVAIDRRLAMLEGQRLKHDDRRRLKIIVGRGNHSSGGEAVLQRSAQNHLLQRRYKFEQRGGTLIVQPKRS